MDPFPTIDISSWRTEGEEQMGTKPKCWVVDPEGQKWLFKEKSREYSEDDWSEKIASELAELIGLPHAIVELAVRNGKRGVISRSLISSDRSDELIPGSRLLLVVDPQYPAAPERIYHVSQHTVGLIQKALCRFEVGLPPGWSSPFCEMGFDLFVGFLLFDAWIGNTDRHHENWAVVKTTCGETVPLTLCPSYDHASSLGHNERDEKRIGRLTTRDRGFGVDAFARKARSAFFRDTDQTKPMTTTDAFLRATEFSERASAGWVEKLRHVTDQLTTDIVSRVSSQIMGDHAKRFALELLRVNRVRLTYREGSREEL